MRHEGIFGARLTTIGLLLLQAALGNHFACAQYVLKDVKGFENIRFEETARTNATVTRVGNVDVVLIDSQPEPIPFCHLPMLLPFTQIDFRRSDNASGVPVRKSLLSQAHTAMVAALLAVQHLNTGNGTIVRELDGLVDRCNIRFTTEVLDSARDRKQAVQHVLEMVNRDPGLPTKALPCAILGAAHSFVSIPTSITSGLYGYPQISPISTSPLLDDINQFPLFGRSIPTNADTAIPAIQFLRYELGVKYLAVLHVDDTYGNGYAAALQLAAAEYSPDMTVLAFDFPFESTAASLESAMENLAQTNFRYFFGIIYGPLHYEAVMTAAYKHGLAGTGSHSWMFSEAVNPSYFNQDFERGSALHLASTGAMRIGAIGGIAGMNPVHDSYDKFLQSIRDLDNLEDIDYIESKYPTYPDEPDFVLWKPSKDHDALFSMSSDTMVPFMYDATIAIGLAACAAAEANEGRTYFDGRAHFDAFKNKVTFRGATGKNVYDARTGTRDASTTQFAILNFYPDENESTDSRVVLRSVKAAVFSDGQWIEQSAIVFNDNTNVPPRDLPPANMDYNYIGPGLRAVSLLLSGLILCCSVLASSWTHIRRNSRVIRASQPFFLHIISAGVFLMGSAIIFLSLDDNIASPSTLRVTCSLTVWFFSTGWVISFSALFTKTNRINKILHNPGCERIRVTIRDVLKPMLVLTAVSVIILSLWTILNPPVWRRTPIDFDEFSRTIESVGHCTYGETGAPYLIPLTVVFTGILAYAVYEAYVARKLSTEFAESEYICIILLATLLVFFMGIPVGFLAGRDNRAFLFVATCIIFVVCMAMLLLIFVPKVIYHRNNAGKQRQHVHVSGLTLIESQHEDTCSPTEADDSGILVLQHPKEVEILMRSYRASLALGRPAFDLVVDDDNEYNVSSTQAIPDDPVSQSNDCLLRGIENGPNIDTATVPRRRLLWHPASSVPNLGQTDCERGVFSLSADQTDSGCRDAPSARTLRRSVSWAYRPEVLGLDQHSD